jgi:hypothetical protein
MCVHPPENAPKKYKDKILRYEQSLNQMLQEIQSLLSDCLSKALPLELCKKRLMKLLLDSDGILPPIHYIGSRVIEMFAKDPEIEKSEIINLCKNPSNFFSLYSHIAEKHGMPKLQKDITQKILMLV